VQTAPETAGTPGRTTTDATATTATWQETAAAAAAVIRERSGAPASGEPAVDTTIDTAVVLGSGWGQAADLLGEVVVDLPADEVPGFRASAVAGHHGRLRVVRTPAGRRVLLIAARTHLYEGHGVDAVAHGVRTAAALGARHVVLTNGCGSLVPEWGPGTAVLLRDHLNLTGATPLRGATFVDLTEAYSPRLRAIAHEVDPSLPEGVYAQMHGPAYETPAEVAMVGVLGGQLVGMSTALETIAARAVGLEVLGLSLVTNSAAGTTGEVLDHEEVLQTGRDSAERCGRLLADVVDRVARA
jgi:purine-nucleoside phosphorylase